MDWNNFPNESSLGYTDRLALAAMRLNAYEWDEILGPKPVGFDELPVCSKTNLMTGTRTPSKTDFVRPARLAITNMIGEAAVSRFWWIYGLGRSEEEWFRWYISPDGPYGLN